MKKLQERYKAPTPAWAKKTGAVMFLLGNAFTGDALFKGNPILGAIGMALTLGSKVMNIFVDESAN